MRCESVDNGSPAQRGAGADMTMLGWRMRMQPDDFGFRATLRCRVVFADVDVDQSPAEAARAGIGMAIGIRVAGPDYRGRGQARGDARAHIGRLDRRKPWPA